MEFSAKTTIDAQPSTIWTILTDASKYPEWDPFAEKIEGTIRAGAKIKAFSKLSPGRGFKVKVTELIENERMTWQGGMPLGLFKGVRTFALSSREDGKVDFAMREVFSGPMLGMIKGSLPDMTEAFEAFARGLKERAESSS